MTITNTLARRGFLTGAIACLAGTAGAKPKGPQAIVEAARAQIGVTTIYDPSYVKLAFPQGDLPRDRGVCADVVVRALRDSVSLDLQALVNADMKAHFAQYPQVWGLKKPDPNIDHRRVLNLEVFFTRFGHKLAPDTPLEPGDFVTWRLPGNLPHIGIISDRKTPKLPMLPQQHLIIHNVGAGTQEEDVLNVPAWKRIGAYRYPI